jgi:hypothetical protein
LKNENYQTWFLRTKSFHSQFLVLGQLVLAKWPC